MERRTQHRTRRTRLQAGLLCFQIAMQATACIVYDEKLAERTLAATEGGSGSRTEPELGDGGDAAIPTTRELDDQAARARVDPDATRCGDGIISGPEKCDTGIENELPGSCPIACPPLAPCAQRALNGSACQSECVLIPPTCGEADRCCPAGCGADTDKDCSRACGDGMVEAGSNETCEPGTESPCPASDAECADEDPCTVDELVGSARNCNAMCVHEVIVARIAGDGCCPAGATATDDSDCAARCGNGVRESGESCDGEAACNSTCTLVLTSEQQSCLDTIAQSGCERCRCEQCTTAYLACVSGRDEAVNQLCGAVTDCTDKSGCEGMSCWCGAAGCNTSPGPCRDEVERAAGTTDPVLLGIRLGDPSTALGKSYVADNCMWRNCREACQPEAAP